LHPSPHQRRLRPNLDWVIFFPQPEQKAGTGTEDWILPSRIALAGQGEQFDERIAQQAGVVRGLGAAAGVGQNLGVPAGALGAAAACGPALAQVVPDMTAGRAAQPAA
jgi:hypothetical protein